MTSLKMHCYRKSCESHQARNKKFLLDQTVQVLCVSDFTGFTTELKQDIIKEIVDMAKKDGREG